MKPQAIEIVNLAPGKVAAAKPKPRRWGRRRVLWLTVALLVIYPLSTGPVFAMCSKGWLPDSVLEVVYAPFFSLMLHCPPVVRGLWFWYISEVWGWSPT